MKKIIVLVLLLASFESISQVKQKPVSYGVQYNRVQADSGMRIPTVQVGIKDFRAGFDTAQIRYNKTDSTVETYTGSQWIPLRGAGGGGSGTVTNVSALTLGTTGTDLSSSVANSTTTPVITLNVPTASASNRGALSAADWITFNSKGSGTVTSVSGLTPLFTVANATTTPTFSLISQNQNLVYASPNGSSGVPSFRALVAGDLPSLSGLYVPLPDSSTLSNPTGYVKGKAIMGVVVTSTFPGPAIPSGFSEGTGGATITYSSGLNISGGNGVFDNNFVKSTYISQSNNYVDTIEFTINTKPTDHTGGLVFGKIGNMAMYVRMKFTTSDSCKAEMRVVNGGGNGTTFDSTTNISMANGGTYRMVVSQSVNTIFFRISRIVGGLETEFKSQLFTIPVNTYYQLPNMGGVGVAVLGGDYKVTKLNQTNYDYVRSDVAIVGTSITQAYSPTSPENHYIKKAFDDDKTYINFGTAGGGVVDFLTGLTELFEANPVAIGIEGGVNDDCANLRLYASAYIDSLFAHGYSPSNVFWIKPFTSACKDTIIYNLCREKGILLLDPGILMNASMYQDGTHPNDSGYAFMSKFIKAAAPQFFGSTGGIDNYSLHGLRDVYLNGEVTGDILEYNGTTGKWNNVNFITQGNFINNQQASAQSAANFFIDGNGSLNNSLGVGGQTTGAAKIQIFENDANGNGMTIRNEQAASGATKVLQLVVKGGSAAEGADWNNAAVIEGVPNGGLVFDAYATTGYKFQITRTTKMWFNNTGLGIGITPAAFLHVLGTTEQQRTGYDASNYYSTTVGSTGSATLNLVGTTPEFTFSDAVNVPDEAYGAGWNGNTEVPTKNALYDKIETLGGSGITVGTTTITSGTDTRVIYNNAGVVGEYPVTGSTNVVMSASPTLTGTVGAAAITQTGQYINSLNGAASTPPGTFTGTWFTGGSATTTKPQLLIEPSGTTTTGWSTSGTGIGINSPSGFAGKIIDAQNIGKSIFSIDKEGLIAVDAATGSSYQGLGIYFNGSLMGGIQQSWNGGTMKIGSFNNGWPVDFYANNSIMMRLTNGGNFLVGTTTDNSKLTVNGSFATAYVAKSANYTATSADYTIECTANTFQVTLPTSVGITGRIYNIVNSGAGVITIGTTSSQTFVNVVATPTTLTLSAVGVYQVQANGANWMVLSVN